MAEKAQILKEIGTIEIKDAEKGEVEAVVATLGVVDKDEDVILHDAIKDGSKVAMSSYGHDLVFGGDTPVGKGKIVIDGDKAVFKGRMFLATQRGRETFEVLKEMGGDQQWSFGFRILGSEVPDEDWRKKGARRILTKIDAFEVSPVLIGAGIGTRTLGVKDGDPDPAIEAARLEAEKKARDAEAARLATEQAATKAATALAQVNASADRLFKRGANV